MLSHDEIFRKVIHLVTIIVLYILLIAIIVGMYNVFQNVGFVWLKKGGFGQVVYSILTIFVLIDLFKAFADYQVHERIRLTYVCDATLMLVLREITVLIYSHEFKNETLLVFGALLLVLAIVRFIAIRYSPTDSIPAPLSLTAKQGPDEK
ncbi:MAG: phosphate-starvation-inducible PsiE family protein [Methanolobus sp.]|nr:phosphate-starvation-inducible PsiE family protein [Methanolobus sp.]